MDIKENNFRNLLSITNDHCSWMDETINLIASENKISPVINQVLASDFGNRVAEGWIGQRVFPGIKYYDEIEQYGMDLVCSMFGADFADIRPISGSMANMIVFSAFTNPGDVIATLSISSGAHISMAGTGPKKVLGLNVIHLPFNVVDLTLDIEKSIEILQQKKPKMLVLGGSVILFAQPVKELAAICRELGIMVLFDAAHVAGLIATGYYPNPLDEGADIMTMTVCKTIPGPQHAFILSKSKFAEKIKKTTFPGFLSGHHLHETVASVLVMEEMKIVGKAYIRQVLNNAKKLAETLSSYGFDVLAKHRGFTQTHMLLIDSAKLLPANEAEVLLEKANIIVNRNMLPNDESFLNPSGLRLGTPELTKVGFKENHMELVAQLIKKVLIEKVSVNDVKKEVVDLRKSFTELDYCLM